MRVANRVAPAIAAAVLVTTAVSGRTATWTLGPRDLEDGTAAGVALTSRGVLFPAPHLVRIGEPRLPSEPGQIWSIATDASGTLYLGTGPDGVILRLLPSGKASAYFRTAEPLVTALAFASDGALLAGTAPGGRVYRIKGENDGAVWSETGERYVWALAAAPDGTVYAGTGERGVVLRIDRSGSAESLFDGDDAHIVTLAMTNDGAILSGGAGRGLAHRIEPGGKSRVLLQAELPEVVGIAGESDGGVVLALAGAAAPEYQPPAVLIQLPDGTRVGPSDESLGTLSEDEGPILRGFIEGLPAPGAMQADQERGEIVRVHPDGRIESLWTSRGTTAFCVLVDGDGVLFGTGEPARLYRVDADGDVALLATLPEAQVTRIARSGAVTYIGTSNPAAVYRIDGPKSEPSTFVSQPVDAGGPARWGVLRWVVDGSSRVEIATRTGNSREPDETWAAWSVPLVDGRGSAVPSPDGRYLQWRVRFPDTSRSGPRVRDLSVRYVPYNRPPQIRGFRLDSPDWIVSGEATFRWEAFDPDGDPVRVLLESRAVGGSEWIPVPWETPTIPSPEERVGWRDDRRTWDTSSIPEGAYEIRGRATDDAGNPPGEEASTPIGAPRTLIVDRTPPRIEWTDAGAGQLRITVRDDHSEVRRLDWVVAGETRASLRAADGVCDSGQETFELELPPDAPATILRAVDAAGNRAEAGLPGRP